ncbi:conserved hypothetical protein [Trichinella spiralis]|uniref:hypothetical protein n=1 Tax=Trichinella spiralis TaxID=6334 RepID=UPI0001EFE42E|nr:conserved hypothetical protein [Trichinella spiralis]
MVTMLTRQQDDGRIRYMYNLITSSAELLWSFICSGHRDKSCSHHFVQNVALQTSRSELVEVGAVTLPGCSSVVSLIIRSVEQRSYTSLQRIVSALPICGLCRLMRPVLMPTSVHL